jgi:hypothetical protein
MHMTLRKSLRTQLIALAAAAASLGAAPPAPPAAPVPYVTARDVAVSNEKARIAYRHLVSMWGAGFDEIGTRFAPPRLVRFRGAIATRCGVVGSGNAAYCPADNAIVFDEIFLAAQAKSAARELGTDGDMAAVGVIAHEMGHADAIQLGHHSPITYENERAADCLARSRTATSTRRSTGCTRPATPRPSSPATAAATGASWPAPR